MSNVYPMSHGYSVIEQKSQSPKPINFHDTSLSPPLSLNPILSVNYEFYLMYDFIGLPYLKVNPIYIPDWGFTNIDPRPS